jgi:hypothetical protein
MLIDNKDLMSKKFHDFFENNSKVIKVDNKNLNDFICENIKLETFTRNLKSGCSYNFQGSFSGGIPIKFQPIYDENGVIDGYTDISYEYDKSSTTNMIKNRFYIKSNQVIKRSYIPANNCFIPINSLLPGVLNDQNDCEKNSDYTRDILAHENFKNKIFPSFNDNNGYIYYGTYIIGDQTTGSITIPINKDEKFQIITGPSSDNLYIELYSSDLKLFYREKLKIYNSWTDVSLNKNLDLGDDMHLKLIDDGTKWGQWLGVRFKKL